MPRVSLQELRLLPPINSVAGNRAGRPRVSLFSPRISAAGGESVATGEEIASMHPSVIY